MSIGAPGGRQRGQRLPPTYYREEPTGIIDWGGVVAQQVATVSQISSENQQAMQQLLAKTAQMVTHQEVEDILQRRMMSRQEAEVINEGVERRLDLIEGQLKVQPAVTRSWLMVILTGAGCLVTLLGVFASVAMSLLLFALQHFIK